MTRSIRAFLAFIRFAEYRVSPEWTDGDAQNLTSFLASETGEKLKLILVNQVVRQNDSAVSSGEPSKACPFANGFRYAVAFLESLAKTKISEDPSSGTDDDLERFSP